jgi:hypothetical protein
VGTDTIRAVAAAKVKDPSGVFHVGALFNCKDAAVEGYETNGMNLSYLRNASPNRFHSFHETFYVHEVDGRGEPTQALGVVEIGGAEFWVLMRYVEDATKVFAARCGFARPDGRGGLRGSCDETIPNVLKVYPVADAFTR